MNEKLTLGSLFDGSGGFPLSALIAGITPLWASEIEPFPIRVTTKRLPKMKHLGSITEINGGEIEPVDIISMGSPCQDLSIAGKREGLIEGKRSSLFFEALRIIKEMREKTNGEKPRYIIWENVTGALNSSKGEDFRAVIEGIARIKYHEVSIPIAEKWTGGGLIMEDDFSLAWRVLNAQYWGVPQRRKRIYLVADLNSSSAGKVLFESEGLPGYNPKSFRTWEETPTGIGISTPKTGTICLNDQGGERMDVTVDFTATLRANSSNPPLVFQNHSQDSRFKGPIEVADAVLATYGTGGNNQPLICSTPKLLKIRCGVTGQGGRGALIQDNKSATLSCSGNEQTLFEPVAFALLSKDSSAMKSKNPYSGIKKSDVSLCLDTAGKNPACNQGGMMVVDKELYSASKESFFTKANKELASTLAATDSKDPPIINEEIYRVRRLMPTECARLQGFPDWWCKGLEDENPSDEELSFWRNVFVEHAKAMDKKNVRLKSDAAIRKWLKNPHTDSAEYKMWGNGIALPCAVYVMTGIVFWSKEEK